MLLSNIILKVSLSANKDRIIHPILEALKVIKRATLQESDAISVARLAEVLTEPLTTFISECKLSLAHRVMASNNGAYSSLIQLIMISKVSKGSY